MTSNIGARFIEKKRPHGLRLGASTRTACERISEMVMGEVKRTFNPEFINRLDEIILFDALIGRRPGEDHPAAGRADQPRT